MISNLTFKLSYEVQQQLINRDEPSTDFFKYAKRCQRVYQGLKDLAHTEALEESMEQSVETAAASIQKVSTKLTTIQTARSSRHLVTSKKDQLMKKERCFSCREVGHKTMNYLSKRKLTSKQKPMSKLSLNCMTMQKSEQKESRAVVLEAIMLRAEESNAEPNAKKPHVNERPLIVSLSSLPGDFFMEEALVAPCTLENNGEIRTTTLLDTGATEYSFVDPSMARRICDDLLIKPIKLSKPKAIRGFDGKQAPNVTHAIYPTMTIQTHIERITPMLITKLGRHQIILGKPLMKKHGAVLDMRTD